MIAGDLAMPRILLLVAVLLVAATGAPGQDRTTLLWRENAPVVQLTGDPRVDLIVPVDLSRGPALPDETAPPVSGGKKSVWLAAGLSLAVPGAGEFYSQSYWKSALFFAAEVGAWIVAYTYNRKGNQQTDFFQGYANAHWSVTQYVNWTLQHTAEINPAFTGDVSSYNIGPRDANGAVISVTNWDELNRLERDLGNWYSHTLPPYGTQQYYELIGKYPQFNEGWSDADLSLPGDYTQIKAHLSTESIWYDGERGKANTYYTTSSTAVAVAIVNHVLSALDAAWSAGSYNRAHVEMGLQRIPVPGGSVDVPLVRVSYRW